VRLVVPDFLSLDGYNEAPAGENVFNHTGWTERYRSDEIEKFKLDELFATDAVRLGGITYQDTAA
jgi:hypothetical protein